MRGRGGGGCDARAWPSSRGGAGPRFVAAGGGGGGAAGVVEWPPWWAGRGRLRAALCLRGLLATRASGDLGAGSRRAVDNSQRSARLSPKHAGRGSLAGSRTQSCGASARWRRPPAGPRMSATGSNEPITAVRHFPGESGLELAGGQGVAAAVDHVADAAGAGRDFEHRFERGEGLHAVGAFEGGLTLGER